MRRTLIGPPHDYVTGITCTTATTDGRDITEPHSAACASFGHSAPKSRKPKPAFQVAAQTTQGGCHHGQGECVPQDLCDRDAAVTSLCSEGEVCCLLVGPRDRCDSPENCARFPNKPCRTTGVCSNGGGRCSQRCGDDEIQLSRSCGRGCVCCAPDDFSSSSSSRESGECGDTFMCRAAGGDCSAQCDGDRELPQPCGFGCRCCIGGTDADE
ncbi:chorion class high-cysteine HCB protein 13-like [Penaeus chinensis]|uniref:chorion class high-cysteine HCB protein 13-like n=1 Tax=Penaeus chinensis TaxID=139456 RepID=UPI001FB62087|nr:chorion class high-cysteine HCB protein 13-like [Penaeus chinensis]